MSAASPRPPTEPSTARPLRGGVFHVRAQVLNADDVRRAVTRIAHEIVERNRGDEHVVRDRAGQRRHVAGRAR